MWVVAGSGSMMFAEFRQGETWLRPRADPKALFPFDPTVMGYQTGGYLPREYRCQIMQELHLVWTEGPTSGISGYLEPLVFWLLPGFWVSCQGWLRPLGVVSQHVDPQLPLTWCFPSVVGIELLNTAPLGGNTGLLLRIKLSQ